MSKSHQPDYYLITIIFVLVVLGLIILSSASVVLSQDFFSENYYFLKHQIIYSLPLGLFLFLIFQKFHYQHLKKLSLIALIFSIILLGLVFAPGFNYQNEGVKRWLILGNFSFQPFEIVKLTFIVYLAALLSDKKIEINETIKKSFVPLSIILGTIGLLVINQPNISALIFIVLLAGVIYFLAEAKLSYLFAAGIVIMILCGILTKAAPYRMARLTIFLHPEMDPQGIGYQINQATLAIGSGGFFGLGLGHSIQKWKYLPEVIGDSIFAVSAEELGFIGAGTIVLLFMLLAWRGLRIAKKSPDKFGYLLAGGITIWLFAQAFINMAAISGLIPLTGIPLPFISYGGSSLVISLAGAGILTNISRYS